MTKVKDYNLKSSAS